jgi:hypothetical protein
MELFCAAPECEEEIIGRGILMWDPVQNVDWQSHGIKNVLFTSDGEGGTRQALALHITCFNQVFDEVSRREGAAVLTVVIGGVGDFKMAMSGVEEDE